MWDLKDSFPLGSKYKAARLRAPEVVRMLAAAPEQTAADPELEDFDPLMYRLAEIQDRLSQLLYATLGHRDLSDVPTVKRPELPHIKERKAREQAEEQAQQAQFSASIFKNYD